MKTLTSHPDQIYALDSGYGPPDAGRDSPDCAVRAVAVVDTGNNEFGTACHAGTGRLGLRARSIT